MRPVIKVRGSVVVARLMIHGSSLLAAGMVAGGLWTAVGPGMTFYIGAAFAAIALAGLPADRYADRLYH